MTVLSELDHQRGAPITAGEEFQQLLVEIRARARDEEFDRQKFISADVIERFRTLGVYRALVPKRFGGWYVQAAYQLFQSGDYTLSPFVRFERFNTAKAYAALPAGLGVPVQPDQQVATVGANLRVGQGVVLKADYQKFREDKTRDRVNLGLGFAY